jgi:hypothetical protein
VNQAGLAQQRLRQPLPIANTWRYSHHPGQLGPQTLDRKTRDASPSATCTPNGGGRRGGQDLQAGGLPTKDSLLGLEFDQVEKLAGEGLLEAGSGCKTPSLMKTISVPSRASGLTDPLGNHLTEQAKQEPGDDHGLEAGRSSTETSRA